VSNSQWPFNQPLTTPVINARSDNYWQMHACTHPSYGPLDFVWDYPGEPVPEPIWILRKRQWVAVASAGPYTNLHLAPENHASTPHHSVFTGWMPFLQPNQQRQSTNSHKWYTISVSNTVSCHAKTLQQSPLRSRQQLAGGQVTWEKAAKSVRVFKRLILLQKNNRPMQPLNVLFVT